MTESEHNPFSTLGSVKEFGGSLEDYTQALSERRRVVANAQGVTIDGLHAGVLSRTPDLPSVTETGQPQPAETSIIQAG